MISLLQNIAQCTDKQHLNIFLFSKYTYWMFLRTLNLACLPTLLLILTLCIYSSTMLSKSSLKAVPSSIFLISPSLWAAITFCLGLHLSEYVSSLPHIRFFGKEYNGERPDSGVRTFWLEILVLSFLAVRAARPRTNDLTLGASVL